MGRKKSRYDYKSVFKLMLARISTTLDLRLMIEKKN